MHVRLRLTVLAVVLLLATVGPAAALHASLLSAADSLYTLAETRLDRGDYSRAAELYLRAIRLIDSHNGRSVSPHLADIAARSRFLAGRSYEKARHWSEAIDAYAAALEELPAISDAVRMRLARCEREHGDPEKAASLLREVVGAAPRTTLYLSALEELGDGYRASGDDEAALQCYRQFVADASGYDDCARARLKLGIAYRKAGDAARAKENLAASVSEFPRSRYAYDALKEGRALSRSFTDRYHQGLVLYNQQRYREADEFFTHYLRNEKDGEFRAEAAYFLGRSCQRIGNMGAAARKYAEAIALADTSEYFDLAWSKLAYCRRALGNVDESLATYDEYVKLYPERPGAPTMLWEKARLLEEESRWSEAHAAFRDLSDRYPAAKEAPDALFRAGLCLYKLEDYRGAEASFADLFARPPGGDAARALFWAGKCREVQGRPEEAQERYREAAAVARDSFYGRRSLAKLDGERAPFQTGTHPATEALGFGAWAGEWSGGFPSRSRAELVRDLSRMTHFVRGDTFLAVRMESAAAKEFGILEDSLAADPLMLDVLCDYYLKVDRPRRAIRLAEGILALSPAESLSDAPLYLRKRICPIFFGDLIAAECKERGVDPFLFCSLVRQESLFESEAVSGAGARGLAQIMPATGKWIARRLNQRGFNAGDLTDPATSIRFGVYYLSLELGHMGDDTLRALAAYNAGEANAARWWDFGGGRDADVFVEDVGFAETLDYVRRVYLYYQYYRDVYTAEW
jgi:soluble lytic murein transglycosylase